MRRTNSLWRDLVKAARWHRRLLAGVSAAAAVYFGLTALSPAPAPTVAVLGAARDLPGGAVPSVTDLRTLHFPPDLVPTGAVRAGADVAGRVLAAPVRSGEPLTDARFVSPGLAARFGGGVVAYPVRLDDADIAALLRVGDRIDLYAATSSGSSTAGRLAADLRVIALPAPGRRGGSPASAGALVVVAAPPETVARIAQATANSRITLALSPDDG
ncbi:MAG TPA: RcpC/CpaB family pilus assembly protein [Kribbella sp.]|nr:RcpC/CpaB family pilus assembly protein [Kribbella sp.]